MESIREGLTTSTDDQFCVFSECNDHRELYDEYLRIFSEHEQEVLTKLALDAQRLSRHIVRPAKSVNTTASSIA